ncbi:MAG: hypothetical protein FJY95_04165 [Candidatus Handelsmanbacteria bacterium]|nr:hypothetical protein [Candidatus Handelsmanbacteria bacterium]
MYEGSLPLAAPNEVFKLQAQHPLSYYLPKADRAVWGLLCLYLAGWAWPLWGKCCGPGLPDADPLFQLLPRWFWSLELTPLPLAAWLVMAVLSQPARTGRNLRLLILGGGLLQQGLAWMEGRGLIGLSDRLGGAGGHGRLVQAAVSQLCAWLDPAAPDPARRLARLAA